MEGRLGDDQKEFCRIVHPLGAQMRRTKCPRISDFLVRLFANRWAKKKPHQAHHDPHMSWCVQLHLRRLVRGNAVCKTVSRNFQPFTDTKPSYLTNHRHSSAVSPFAVFCTVFFCLGCHGSFKSPRYCQRQARWWAAIITILHHYVC